jgi:hypothetical protein
VPHFCVSVQGFAPEVAQPFGQQPNHQLHQNLSELALIEGIQQVAMKQDELLSPSLFTFRSHFATIHPYYYYDFLRARGARLPWARTGVFSNLGNLLFAPQKL